MIPYRCSLVNPATDQRCPAVAAAVTQVIAFTAVAMTTARDQVTPEEGDAPVKLRWFGHSLQASAIRREDR